MRRMSGGTGGWVLYVVKIQLISILEDLFKTGYSCLSLLFASDGQ